MSPRSSGSSSRMPQYFFVAGTGQSEARSHTMREHWKRRHKRRNEAKTHTRTNSSRTLLPRSTSGSHDEYSPTTNVSISAFEQDPDEVPENRESPFGVPAQLVGGLSHALSSSRPDPFQTCPVHLTSQHQKLLFHWISTHAAMMFEDLHVTEFNPMKDVWFPLDLSNASSFNCIMAHSAAHLSHLYAGTPPGRGTNSADALKYKIEAVRILRLWLRDPEKELSADSFSAVVRLLTFERYWGTVEDWNIHRDGLQRMIDAKGGVEALHENWRLELVVYLWVNIATSTDRYLTQLTTPSVSLMSRPSWLEPTNHLERISRPPLSSPTQQQSPSCDIHKVRCLWLISFIQDMRTFMGSFYTRGLSSFPFTHGAVALLRHDFQRSFGSSSDDLHVSERENELLVCLFSISVLVQESLSALADEDLTASTRPNALDGLEKFLRSSHHTWEHSVHKLRSILYESMTRSHYEGGSTMHYAMDLVQVLGTLSLEARRGVEKCLLNLLYHLGNNGKTPALVDDGWSPDSLLSSIHGH